MHAKNDDSQIITVDKHRITITHPERILFPKDGISKLDLITYYQAIAPTMLRYLKHRPISMQRFPDGIGHEGFYQKDAGDYFPEWIERVEIPTQTGHKTVHYVVCNHAATLVYLVQQLMITPHVWLSTTDHLTHPDRMIFDFDPPSERAFTQVMEAAQAMRQLLTDYGMHPYVMTTGSRGLHVVVPLKPKHTFDQVRLFARTVADQLVAQHPELVTTQVRKEQRKKQVFIDYLRNAWGQTGVAPYAVRARNGAPVATPLMWEELTPRLHAQQYTLHTIMQRIDHHGDPWQDMQRHAVTLPKLDD